MRASTHQDLVARFSLLCVQCADILARVREVRDKAKQQRELSRQRCAEARARRPANLHDVIPLELGAVAVYRRVYEDVVQSLVQGRASGHLDAMGYAIAEFTPIYVYECDASSLRALSKEELVGALFRDGARAMHYLDGRPEVRNLAVSAKALQAIVLALRNARGLGDARKRRRN